jgi:hypothetical protein
MSPCASARLPPDPRAGHIVDSVRTGFIRQIGGWKCPRAACKSAAGLCPRLPVGGHHSGASSAHNGRMIRFTHLQSAREIAALRPPPPRSTPLEPGVECLPRECALWGGRDVWISFGWFTLCRGDPWQRRSGKDLSVHRARPLALELLALQQPMPTDWRLGPGISGFGRRRPFAATGGLPWSGDRLGPVCRRAVVEERYSRNMSRAASSGPVSGRTRARTKPRVRIPGPTIQLSRSRRLGG